jgi:hypothetical protein
VPVVIDLGAVFIAFCAFLVCWMLLQAYSATLGALLGHLADLSRGVTVAGIHVFGWLGNGLDKINHFVMTQLGNAVVGTSWAWHKLVGQTASFIHETARVVNEIATASAQAWDYAWRHGIPQLIQHALDPVWLAQKAIWAAIHEAQHLSHVTTKTVTHVVTNELPRITVKVVEQTAATTTTTAKAVANAIAHPLPRIGALERELHGIDALTKEAWRKLSRPTVFAGLVAAALTSLGLQWLRCTNYRRFGQRICQLHPNVLDDFLLGLVAIFGTLDLVHFAKQVQGVTAETEKAVTTFWRATGVGPGGDRAIGSPTVD